MYLADLDRSRENENESSDPSWAQAPQVTRAAITGDVRAQSMRTRKTSDSQGVSRVWCWGDGGGGPNRGENHRLCKILTKEMKTLEDVALQVVSSEQTHDGRSRSFPREREREFRPVTGVCASDYRYIHKHHWRHDGRTLQ